MTPNKIRNIGIIAHVDHGKTTLVDQLLRQSGTLKEQSKQIDRIMDSNDLEKERGITILSKNTAINWNNYHINIVDTPGHADFGGEVERVLSMVDSVLLLIDAVEGPMPQTRFVTEKAFALGLKPIVVINKIDRDGARADWVIEQTFDLFDELGASDEQLDFMVIYASALRGFAGLDQQELSQDMTPLFKTIVEQVAPPEVNANGAFQMRINTLDYSNYVGLIGIGRVERGSIKPNQPIMIARIDDKPRRGKILQVLGFHGLTRYELKEAHAGDIIAITGIENLKISDTLCHPEHIEPLTKLNIDQPTISVFFQANDSPFAGQDGKYLTSRQISERLDKEVAYNVALTVEETDSPDRFKVSGRGELQLAVFIEQMRREGYELAVSRPEVITKEVDGVMQEPYEQLVVTLDNNYQGQVMEKIADRQGKLTNMLTEGNGRIQLEYLIPTRGLIGFQTEFRTITAGTGVMYHRFDHYGQVTSNLITTRHQGVLIAKETGKAIAYSLFSLQERGRLLISAGDPVYVGQVIGLHNRTNDLTVNPLKTKQLTNIRAAGKDDNILLSTPLTLTLEQALEFIQEDELVEITPKAIRIRKKHLTENERKRLSRK